MSDIKPLISDIILTLDKNIEQPKQIKELGGPRLQFNNNANNNPENEDEPEEDDNPEENDDNNPGDENLENDVDDIDNSDDDEKKQPAVRDFWTLIAALHWFDIGEGINKTSPSKIWNHNEYLSVKQTMDDLYDDLEKALNEANFWGLNPDYQNDDAKQEKFIYHIIAKGKVVYEAILNDTTFAAAFIKNEADFKKFMERF